MVGLGSAESWRGVHHDVYAHIVCPFTPEHRSAENHPNRNAYQWGGLSSRLMGYRHTLVDLNGSEFLSPQGLTLGAWFQNTPKVPLR